MSSRRTTWFNTEVGRRTLLPLLALVLLVPVALVKSPVTVPAEATAKAAPAPSPSPSTQPVLRIGRLPLSKGAVIPASVAAAAHARAAATNKPTLSSAKRTTTDSEGGSTAGIPIVAYTVRAGDTLSAIAARYGTDTRSIEATNGLTDNSIIQPGQKVEVPTQIGWVYSISRGDTLEQIAASAGVSPDLIARANHITGNTILQIGERLWIPHEPPAVGARLLAAAGARPAPATPSKSSSGSSSPQSSSGSSSPQSSSGPASSLALRWPVRGPITSPFGWRILYGRRDFHDGIDIGVPMHTPVHAAMSGKVTLAGWDGPYGIAVEIKDGNVVTLYAHNSYVEVHVGQYVKVGQVISSSGMTGNATGPHVHFGVYISGRPENPFNFLP